MRGFAAGRPQRPLPHSRTTPPAATSSPTLTLTAYPQNTKYRVRVDYVRSSKDTTNLSTDGGWMYFIVVK